MKDFLSVADFSSEEISELLNLALELKKEYFSTGNKPLFKGKVLGMVFQKPSLRTRVSFDMAMRHMEGDALYLSPSEIGLGKRESIADVARVLKWICFRYHGESLCSRTCSRTGKMGRYSSYQWIE